MATPLSTEESLRRIEAIQTPAEMAQFLRETMEPEDVACTRYRPVLKVYTAREMIDELLSGTDVGREYFDVVKRTPRIHRETEAKRGPPKP